jgi:hypothetical protein
MVVVATVNTRFEAELLAAKLGAHGVLWAIRSRELVPTTHPIGFLDVMVPEEERELAQEVLAPDELPVIAEDGTTVPPRAPGPTPLTPAMRSLRIMLALGLLVPLGVFLALWVADALRFLDVVR